MGREALLEVLRKNIQPLDDPIYGPRFRVAGRLRDDTYLPCVVIQSRKATVDLALRRFKETRWRRSDYRRVVETFVSSGSRVADYDLKSVETSPFAWPVDILRTIHGETTMGWTAFVAEMKDGSMHSYGTTYCFEFFELPQGYGCQEIVRIHSGMVYSTDGGLQPFSYQAQAGIRPLREIPFFTCYIDL